MRSYYKLTAFLLVLSSLFFMVGASDTPPCQSCQFNTEPELEGECSVYAVSSTDTVIPWHRATETCLQALNVSLAAVNKENMWEICPTANATGVNGTTNVNMERLNYFLQDTNSNASNAIKAIFENVLFVTADNGTTYTLPDRIIDTLGQVTDCTLSKRLCWGQVAYILGQSHQQLALICTRLHELQIPSLIKEQGVARETICELQQTVSASAVEQQQQVVELVPSSCEPLALQIQEFQANAPEQCSALAAAGLPETTKLPVCQPESTSSANNRMGTGTFLGFAVVAVFYLII